jgi:hypothetical protein
MRGCSLSDAMARESSGLYWGGRSEVMAREF